MNSVEKALVEQLSPILLPLKFDWVRSRGRYIRRESYGFSSLLWASNSTGAEGGRLELTPVLGVRHDAVEDAVNRLDLVRGDENRRYTTTVARGLGYFPFHEGEDERHYVRLASVDGDIKKAVRGFAALIGGEGSMFFERYASVLECSRGLNEPIRSRKHPLCNNFPLRAYYGIATAAFSERSRVPGLIDEYLGYAKEVLPAEYDEIARRIDQLNAAVDTIA